MIKVKTLEFTVLLIILLSGFFSCIDDEIIATSDGDAFITVSVEQNDTLYGLALHCLGNKDLGSVTVTNDKESSYNLASYNGSNDEYFYEAGEDFLSKTLPNTGEYIFSFTFEGGETDSTTDILTKDCIYPTNITTCEYDSTDEKINLEWDINEDADFIVIYLTDEDGNTTFISNSIAGSATSYSISSDTEYWGDYIPVNGTKYTVTIYMYSYETDQEALNIQCRAENYSTVIWGE